MCLIWRGFIDSRRMSKLFSLAEDGRYKSSATTSSTGVCCRFLTPNKPVPPGRPLSLPLWSLRGGWVCGGRGGSSFGNHVDLFWVLNATGNINTWITVFCLLYTSTELPTVIREKYYNSALWHLSVNFKP